MCGAFERQENDFWELKNRGRISFRFARIKIDFKVSIITHFNGEIDSHIWMLRESLRESILGFSPNF